MQYCNSWWKLPASDLGNVANPLNGSDQLRAKAVVTRLEILDLILAFMFDVIVSKGKMKLNLKYVGDSMLCERRWEGELSVKLTVGAVEDHAIVPALLLSSLWSFLLLLLLFLFIDALASLDLKL